MFPLGTVLFPSLVLPLHVFEPRYRALIGDVLDDEGEFGVCLIARGSEVGGGDERLDIGTVASVREAAELPDGRWAIVAVGTRRIRVVEWFDDDPYPIADAVDHPDPPPGPAELELLQPVTASVRRALNKVAEIGGTDVPELDLSDDPTMASHQLAALAPVGALDQHRLLSATTVGLRLATLNELLPAAHEILDSRLAEPGDDHD